MNNGDAPNAVPGDDDTATALVTRIRADDRQALADLYRHYYNRLWRLALLLTHSPDQANEVTQDIFLAIWEKRATLTIHTDIRVYLFAAVRNRVHSLHRHAKTEQLVSDTVVHTNGDIPALGAAHLPPDMAAESEEFRTAYIKALHILGDRERLAVLLRWEEQLTFSQIGHILGLSDVGARLLIVKAQKIVQEHLAVYRD